MTSTYTNHNCVLTLTITICRNLALSSSWTPQCVPTQNDDSGQQDRSSQRSTWREGLGKRTCEYCSIFILKLEPDFFFFFFLSAWRFFWQEIHLHMVTKRTTDNVKTMWSSNSHNKEDKNNFRLKTEISESKSGLTTSLKYGTHLLCTNAAATLWEIMWKHWVIKQYNFFFFVNYQC